MSQLCDWEDEAEIFLKEGKMMSKEWRVKIMKTIG